MKKMKMKHIKIWDIAKARMKIIFKALNGYIRKKESSQINQFLSSVTQTKKSK